MKKFLLKIVLFTFILLMCTLTIELVCRLIKIPKISHNNISAKGQALIPKIDNNSVLLLGDSRIEWGLKTQEIYNANGNVLNLAFPGSNGFDILQYLLKKKIYPKTIIIGFTPNYYISENHDFDKLQPSIISQFKASFKYLLKQHSYFVDFDSIAIFLQGTRPYLINHIYDDFGNVVVKENGYFYERYQPQKKMYTIWHEQFNEISYDKYLIQLNNIMQKFRDKSTVYGLYMPVSDTIFSLERTHYDKAKISNIYDHYLDFSEFIPKNDSLYFYDGSHLAPDYAFEFTRKINRIIEEHERTTKNIPH